MRDSDSGGNVAIVPFVVVGGGGILVLFAFIPLAVVFVRGQDPFSAFGVVWLLFPAFSLLLSALDWLGGRRRRATVDTLVAGGVSWAWLFLVAGQVGSVLEVEMGLWPFFLAGVALLLTVAGFLLLLWALSPATQNARHRGKAVPLELGLLYVILLAISLLAMLLIYGLEFYFRLLA